MKPWTNFAHILANRNFTYCVVYVSYWLWGVLAGKIFIGSVKQLAFCAKKSLIAVKSWLPASSSCSKSRATTFSKKTLILPARKNKGKKQKKKTKEEWDKLQLDPYTPFTRSNKHRANVEQMYQNTRANCSTFARRLLDRVNGTSS